MKPFYNRPKIAMNPFYNHPKISMNLFYNHPKISMNPFYNRPKISMNPFYNHPKISINSFYNLLTCLKIAEWVENGVDPNQMLHSAASDLCLHCLPVSKLQNRSFFNQKVHFSIH